jgi:DNA-binding MarR family transcriptional regulator
MPNADTGPYDSVDRLLADWARADPDLDLSPVAIVLRLGRLRRIIDSELEATFAEHGLNGADFAALATLRRLERAGGVSQRTLMRELRLTSGTVSVRVERLSGQGLVNRDPDPQDGRNTLVSLTPAGRGLFERVTPAHIDTENRLLAALGPRQREALIRILRELLVSFEGSACDGDLPRLGLTLQPAHVAIEVRRAAGLPEVAGLLVRAVASGGRGDRGGVKVGDVLVQAGGRELRSVTSLYAAMRDNLSANVLHVGLARGVDSRLDTELDLRPDGPGSAEGPARSAARDVPEGPDGPGSHVV